MHCRKKNCIILSVIRKHAYPLKTARTTSFHRTTAKKQPTSFPRRWKTISVWAARSSTPFCREAFETGSRAADDRRSGAFRHSPAGSERRRPKESVCRLCDENRDTIAVSRNAAGRQHRSARAGSAACEEGAAWYRRLLLCFAWNHDRIGKHEPYMMKVPCCSTAFRAGLFSGGKETS